jgi:methionyl-tRNA synthetase
MTSKNKFYVTTPIYYVTAKPHLGSLYSTLIADVLARWHKMKGEKVFFLTGTDEHGQKVAQAAHQAGKDPKAFVDSFIPAYQDAWKTYEIEYTKFIRTTDHAHIKGAQQFVQKLLDKGDIYKDSYSGWYCIQCETFVTPKEMATSQEQPACPTCSRATVKLVEETYFFKLSAYQDRLLKFYTDNPDFIMPKERLHEVTSFVQAGLKDLSITRTTVKWGIPFPHNPEHTIYVWVEALCNYLTGIGYGQSGAEETFNFWWPADVQVLGKDIIRFHGVYWIALLMAADLPLPKQLLVHGWIKVNEQKMSKSLGNVVDPLVLQTTYGVDPVRYYLMRYIPTNQDGDFSTESLERAIEKDLANDLGNLLNRMLVLAEKNNMLTVNAPIVWDTGAIDLRDECANMITDVFSYMEDAQFHMALARIWKSIHHVNVYFHENEPWKLAQSNLKLFEQVLSATCHSLSTIGLLLWPVMPKKMEALLTSLGISVNTHTTILHKLIEDGWHISFKLLKIAPLFHKPETEQRMEQPTTAPVAVQEPSYIAIEDLMKVELTVGMIEQCEIVPQSDKLFKMQVDFGDKGKRQILSGIRQFYAAEELIGRQGLFTLNLKPRKMLGLESHGMMLMANDATGKPQIMSPKQLVPNGTRLQ